VSWWAEVVRATKWAILSVSLCGVMCACDCWLAGVVGLINWYGCDRHGPDWCGVVSDSLGMSTPVHRGFQC
jgi:hypothetical protein